jgi:hypothetical protein
MEPSSGAGRQFLHARKDYRWEEVVKRTGRAVNSTTRTRGRVRVISAVLAAAGRKKSNR